MQSVPSFTVVIPAYNSAAHIERALRSVLSQSVPAAEIVVVDDGSTDETADLVRRFGAPIHCLQQANAGAAAARNAGIGRATHELVALLDADDEWLPHHLAQATSVFSAHPGLAWYSAAYRKHERSGAIRTARIPPGSRNGASFMDFFEATSAGWTCYTPTMIIRRSVFTAVGGFEVSLPTGEDIDLWFRIALRHPTIGHGSEPSVTIHSTPGSLTTRGLFTRARAERLAERWESLAAAGDPSAAPAASGYILRWMIESLLRPALVDGDREGVAWVRSRFSRSLPLGWRMISCTMLATPRGPWSLVASVWTRSRRFRTRLMR